MEERKNHMKRLVGGDFLLDMSPIELEVSVDGTTKTNITDNEVLGQLTDLKRFIGSPSMVKPIWCKLTNGETDELIVARGTLAVVDVGEFEICIPLDGYKLTISVEFTQMETEDHEPLDDWYIDANDAKYILISDAQAIGNIEELPVFENIVDKDGHKRFIEGDITMNTITGITQTYGKWSLCGTHLMIVLSFTVANGSTIGTTAFALIEDIPSWIMDKIIPSGDTEKQVAVKYADEWTDTNYPQTQHLYCGIQKVSNGTALQIARWGGSVSFEADTFFRLQFDLIIDNEETPAP